MRGVPPEGLLASWDTTSWVVGPRRGRSIVGIPQKVDVEGILQGEREKLQAGSACTLGTQRWRAALPRPPPPRPARHS